MAAPTEPRPNVIQRVMRGVDGVQRRTPWLAVPIAVFKKFSDDNGGRLAAVISYYGFFSLFPLLLAFVSMLCIGLGGGAIYLPVIALKEIAAEFGDRRAVPSLAACARVPLDWLAWPTSLS